jgi:hypothetical protein
MTTIAARAATLIATNLGDGLIHPGNTEHKPRQIPLPAFRTAGMPPPLTAHVVAAAQLIGEALVHLLHRHGIDLIEHTELERLRNIDPNQPPPATISIDCPHGHPILLVAARPHVRLHTNQLISCQHEDQWPTPSSPTTAKRSSTTPSTTSAANAPPKPSPNSSTPTPKTDLG